MAIFNTRAWHEESKSMVYFNNSEVGEDMYQSHFYFELLRAGKLEISTGYFDVNGKEIFEGDNISFEVDTFTGKREKVFGSVKFKDAF